MVWAVGAQGDNLPPWFRAAKAVGQRAVSAREVVYWYNGHPDYEEYHLPVGQTRNVVIVGTLCNRQATGMFPSISPGYSCDQPQNWSTPRSTPMLGRHSGRARSPM